MELENRDFRAMMFYDFKRGLNVQQSHQNFIDAFGQDAPSERTIRRWFAKFRGDQESFEDEPRSGRPPDSATPENIERVRELIKQTRNITYEEIQQTLGIGASTVHSILHRHLGVRKLASRWVPHLLTDEQKEARIDFCHFMLEKFDQGRSKEVGNIVTGDETWIYAYDPETKQQSTVWVFEDEIPPTKVTRAKSVSKQMVAIFFRRSGPVAAIPLVERKTVNAEWYTTQCLPRVFEELSKTRPKAGLRRLFLHHDNARPHTAARTLDFLAESEMQLLPHPPYSPDLAPNDFFLIPEVKKHLRGKRYDSPEAAVTAMNQILDDMPKELFVKCFDDWFFRMHKCIDAKGCYFEKL